MVVAEQLNILWLVAVAERRLGQPAVLVPVESEQHLGIL
jgi:hypothetical protein